ncbi:MAG: hypothetical protein K6F25_00180 [Bacteroidales bacterium]|nr:hypothetical protein [Bacteroidales bacterium]
MYTFNTIESPDRLEFYEMPECVVTVLVSEGILCQSGDNEDYDIIYPW